MRSVVLEFRADYRDLVSMMSERVMANALPCFVMTIPAPGPSSQVSKHHIPRQINNLKKSTP